MTPLVKNLLIVLGLCTIGFAAYFIFMQQVSNSPLSFKTNDAVMENMLSNSRLFIERRQALEQVSLNLSFFTDERFTSLESFTRALETPPVGRSNPFAPVDTN